MAHFDTRQRRVLGVYETQEGSAAGAVNKLRMARM